MKIRTILCALLLNVAIYCHADWEFFLDGSTLPEVPWIIYQDGLEEEREETVVVDFVDPVGGAANQALRVRSGTGITEWYIGPFPNEEVSVGLRFRVTAVSDLGKENIVSVTTRSKHLAPAPAITLVNGRFKLWNYVHSDTEIIDIGPVDLGVFHTTYLYARADGHVKMWWDGKIIFDDYAPLVSPYDGYFEWGSGSWQFDASDTVDFDWVGFGTPAELPLAVTSYPVNGAVFHEAGSGFKFSVLSKAGLAPGVPDTGIKILVNGADRTSELVVSGDNIDRAVTLNGLAADRVYRILVTVKDINGQASKYPIEFDTFRKSSFLFEAEDFNYDSGTSLNQIQVSSAEGPDNYFNRMGVEGIDFHEMRIESGQDNPQLYRPELFVGTQKTLDILRDNYVTAKLIDPDVADYNVTSVEVDEWLNYTRNFPTGVYNIYGRLAANETNANFRASVSKVTGPTTRPTTPVQTATVLGTFKGGLGRGWQTYEYVALTDDQGNPVRVSLGGIETLRVTAVEGSYNANFYLLAPAPIAVPRLGIAWLNADLVISWDGSGSVLESSDRVDGGWRKVEGASSPFQFRPSSQREFFRLRQ